jgi:hypothetical protein
MSDFKEGDRVQRTDDGFGSCKPDTVYTVSSAYGTQLALKELAGLWLSRNFAKVIERPTGACPSTTDWKNMLPVWPAAAKEADPSGLDQHSPGAKVDAGKVRPSLIIEGMARALWAVSEVATFGAAKYTDGGWVLVQNGQARYADAQYRHVLKRAKGELIDDDSNLSHLAHEAWNALAKLDLALREQEKVKVE